MNNAQLKKKYIVMNRTDKEKKKGIFRVLRSSGRISESKPGTLFDRTILVNLTGWD